MSVLGLGRRVKRHGGLATLLAIWWVVVVAETGPHLVHHLFEPPGEVECPFLAAAHHAPAANELPVLIPLPVPTPQAPATPPRPIRRRLLSDRPPTTRAPPPVPLASA